MKYNYQPKTRKELKSLLSELIEERGYEADLNDIDTSLITDMSWLFSEEEDEDLCKFDGDISEWNTKRVKTMENMFCGSDFDGDISRWDVSSVENITGIFQESLFYGDISEWDTGNVKYMGAAFCSSIFNGDISKWNVSNVITMFNLFENSDFNGDISKWDVGNVEDMESMFADSNFNGDISKWNVGKVKNMKGMFTRSKFNQDLSNWNTENIIDTSSIRYYASSKLKFRECDHKLQKKEEEVVQPKKEIVKSEPKELPEDVEKVDYDVAKNYLNLNLTSDGLNPDNLELLRALDKLITIARVWNMMDNFVLDTSNCYQIKWFPRFSYSKDTNRYTYSYSECLHTVVSMYYTDNLCFKTKERSKQFGELYIDLWNIILNGRNK